jgi:hypothetical protein
MLVRRAIPVSANLPRLDAGGLRKVSTVLVDYCSLLLLDCHARRTRLHKETNVQVSEKKSSRSHFLDIYCFYFRTISVLYLIIYCMFLSHSSLLLNMTVVTHSNIHTHTGLKRP